MSDPRFARRTLSVVLLMSGVSAVAAQGIAGAANGAEVWAVVRNFGGTPDAVIAESEQIVNATYDAIGVRVRWMTPEDVKRLLPSDPVSPCTFSSLVLVNLLTRSMEVDWPQDVMGATASEARYIRIAPHRIEERAVDEHVSFGFLMGQVMAHEFGHVFLPHLPHAVGGLMKETLDVRAAQQSRLFILPAQASDMRATIESKLSGCPR